MMNSGATKSLPLQQLLIAGKAFGTVLKLQQSLSFWGGVDPDSGTIIDRQHPQCGVCISQHLLVLPGIKGSTAAPGALLECLYAGNGPAALLLCESDASALIAVSAFEAVSGTSIPVALISPDTAEQLQNETRWSISGHQLLARLQP